MTTEAPVQQAPPVPVDSRPTGEIIVDEVNAIIHGVIILGPKSRNGHQYADSARADQRRIINDAHGGIIVQEGHYAKPAGTTNGYVTNAYEDGVVNRGSWHLNPEHPDTGQHIWNAKNSPQSIALSHEYHKEDEKSKFIDRKMVIVGIRRLRKFALMPGYDGGIASGLNTRIEGKQKMEKRRRTAIKTTEQLRERYPELVEEILSTRVEECSTCTEHEKNLAALKLERDEANEKLAEIENKEKLELRRAAIAEEWKSMLGDIDLESFPEATDQEKAIKKNLKLTEEYIESLVSADPELVTARLKERAELLLPSVAVIEGVQKKKAVRVEQAEPPIVPNEKKETVVTGSQFHF